MSQDLFFSLKSLVVFAVLSGFLSTACAKSKATNNCSAMSRKELVYRTQNIIKLAEESHNKCCKTSSCTDPDILKTIIRSTGAIVGMGAGLAVGKYINSNTKEIITGGAALGILIAEHLIANSCSDSDILEFQENVTSIKKQLNDDDTPIEILLKICESYEEGIRLQSLVASLIKIGRKFQIKMSCDAENKNINMGTITCGNTYAGRYDVKSKKWTISGYSNGEKRIVTATYDNCGDPDNNQICIWGRGYSFNIKLRVLDSDFGEVGILAFEH